MKDHEFRELVNALHDALKTLYAAPVPQAPGVRDGWQLVPKVPTLEMVRACASAARAYMQEHGGNSPHVMWSAMLAAAPQPERSTLNHDAATAYGFLWHVNNESGTPHRYSPERAAYEARKILRGHLSADELGDGINRARALIERSAGDE